VLHAFNIDCIAFKYRPDTKEINGNKSQCWMHWIWRYVTL